MDKLNDEMMKQCYHEKIEKRWEDRDMNSPIVQKKNGTGLKPSYKKLPKKFWGTEKNQSMLNGCQ